MLYEAMPAAFLANVVMGILSCAAQWRVIDHITLAVWFAVLLTVGFLRFSLQILFKRADALARRAPLWAVWFNMGAGASGMVLGSAGVLLFPPQDQVHQIVMVLVICGMIAGAVTSLSFQRFTYIPYLIAAILPLIANLIISGYENSLLLTAMVLLSAVFAYRSSRQIYRAVETSIALRLEALSREANLEHARQALAAAKEIAETASNAKSQFLATMSHELRTPMNGILGMAQLQLMPNLSDEERQEYARIILDSGQTLLTLLNDILDMSKIEAGRVELERLVFDPAQLTNEIMALFAEQAHAKSLSIDAVWSGPPDRRYRADPTRLRQMLSNLVSNAVKFTEKGFVRIAGHAASSAEGVAVLEFSVTDSGVGIPKSDQELLFKPFSQLDASTTRKYGGSGLGLSIVRDLARMMRGDVGVESQEGQGTRFWFRIQAEIASPNEDRRQPDRQDRLGPAPAGSAGLSAGYVLVVDDNLVNRRVIEALLRKQNIRSESIADGRKALEIVTSGKRPILILMDCQMPIMDGFDATTKIRQWEVQGHHPHLPIVALTASAFQEDRDRCMAAGMDGFLTKPINVSELMRVLDKWMGV